MVCGRERAGSARYSRCATSRRVVDGHAYTDSVPGRGRPERMSASERKSLRDTTHRTTNGASCIASVCLPAYIVLGLAGHAAAPRVARQAAALVRRPAGRPITCRSWQAQRACEPRHGRGAWVGRLGYLTVGQHAVEWRAARGVSASGSTYAPTTRHGMWARELDVTHAAVAHASGGRTSETRIVPNVYRGAGSPCSVHARTYPL